MSAHRNIALITSKQGKVARRLVGPLVSQGMEVIFLENLERKDYGQLWRRVDLVVLSKDTPGDLNVDDVKTLRHLFPLARVIGVKDDITPEDELVWREAGVVYLGSCDHFLLNYRHILHSALKKEYPLCE